MATSTTTATKTKAAELPPLMERRDEIWAELKRKVATLKGLGMTMKTSLTTIDGFPRDDIDIPQVTALRRDIIYLQNDYDGIMNQIGAGLEDYHASLDGPDAEEPDFSKPPAAAAEPETPAADEAASAAAASPDSDGAEGVADEIPFARVNSVVEGSPASAAGLREGDLVVRFGEADWATHDGLRRVGRIVQDSEGVEIAVVVRRPAGETETVRLTPNRHWGGRGMLGCHLVPHS